jgi:FG-GAP-like repeat/ASPIC and UnbV
MMRSLIRVFLAILFCVGMAAGAVIWLLDLSPAAWRWTERPGRSSERRAAVRGGQQTLLPNQALEWPEVFDIILEKFEDGGYKTASAHMAPIRDFLSLQELREAVRGRGRRAISQVRSQYEKLRQDSPPKPDQTMEKFSLEQSIGFLYMYEGKFLEAASWLEKALETGRTMENPATACNRLMAVLGVIALRRGEIENCLECIGPSSCIFPIDKAAVHRNQAGSREAIRWFTAFLDESPRDLRVIWLLNIAYMTLGEHPEKVPRKYLIPTELFRAHGDVGRFQNVAIPVGLGARGPNLAGGSVFDDFNGDGLPDLFTTSLDADLGASLYLNRRDGTFEDRSASAGIGDQVYALNVTRADFDNDGDLDVLLLRGAWETPLRLSLLRNQGDGSFADVTVAAGLTEPIATESAAWGDYDNDGLVDVFVCGEYLPPSGDLGTSQPDSRNRCRLYHNRGNGTFVDVAAKAGVTNEQCGKGSAWGDYDDDGRLDLYVSNMNGPCRLYHNEGDGRFRDVAPKLEVLGSVGNFACWFWDYDNDGRLDIFVNENETSLAETAAIAMGMSVEKSGRSRLYRNRGADGFREVTREVGLDRPMAPMGCNFGDIDNDGYLDVYFGTGWMSYSGLIPNLMFKNVEGRRFEDVTISSGTGHLQKGHGVSYADWDCDGDLDLFVEAGGAVPGDKAYNILFRNPGHGRHWLKVKLVGTKTNRAALGAKIRVDLKGAEGATRSIHRTVGNNSSFGGNSLVETIGLRDATRVAELTVSWPTSGTTQVFRDIPANQAIEVTEFADKYRTLGWKPVPMPK